MTKELREKFDRTMMVVIREKNYSQFEFHLCVASIVVGLNIAGSINKREAEELVDKYMKIYKKKRNK